MVKHTQAIRRQIAGELFECVQHRLYDLDLSCFTWTAKVWHLL